LFAYDDILDILLPHFRNIFLGETFSSYISIHNASEAVCRNVSVKVSGVDCSL